MWLRFDFQYQDEGKQIDWEMPIGLAEKLALSPHSFVYQGSLPRDWKQQYYRMFLQHKAEQEPLAVLRASLRKQCGTSEDYVLAALRFVQEAIAYDQAKAYQISSSKIQYPCETLASGKGVCADKTILLAALLMDTGFDLAILSFERANHMALGIAAPAGMGNFGIAYAMMETTAISPIAEVPERYAGGVKLDARPEVTPLALGSQAFQALTKIKQQQQQLASQYGKDYLSLNADKQSMTRQLQALKAEMQPLEQALKQCRGTLPQAKYQECQQIQSKYNSLVAQYNELVSLFNKA